MQFTKNILLFILLLVFTLELQAQKVEQKKVLVLLSHNITIPWERGFIKGLEKTIKDQSFPFDLYFEVIDTTRLGKTYTDEVLFKHLKEKYSLIRFDAVLAESSRAANFLMKYQHVFSSKTPLITFIDEQSLVQVKQVTNFFRITPNIKKNVQRTIEMAKKHNPKLKKIYLVQSDAISNKHYIERIKEEINKNNDLTLEVIKDFSLDELKSQVKEIDKRSAIFYTLVFEDRFEVKYSPKFVLNEIVNSTQAPIYSFYTTFLKTGIVGGYMISPRKVSQYMLEVLNEFFENGRFEQTESKLLSKGYLDYKVLEEKGFVEASSDTELMIVNAPPPIIKYYKDELIVGILIILLLLIVLIYTLYKKSKQKYLLESTTSQILLEQQKEIEVIKNRFQNMFMKHDAVMLLVEPKSGNIIDVNRSAIKFYGYSFSEFKKMKIMDLNTLDKSEVEAKLKEAKKFDHNYFEFPHRLKNGEIRIVEVHSSPIELDDEIILFSIIKDITKVKEYEQSLKESNQKLTELSLELESGKLKYQTLMQSSSDAILIMGMEGELKEYSDKTQNLLGYSDKEMKSLNVFDWDKSLSKEEYQEVVNNIEISKGSISFERVHTRKDGSEYNASITAIKIIVNDQSYIYASVRDITQDKKLQNAIKEQKKELETIFNYAGDGIVIIDIEGNFLKFNDAFMKLTEYTSKELLKKNFDELTAPEDRKNNAKALQRAIETGHVENFEKDCIVNSTKRITVQVSISLLPDKKSLLLIVKDISSIKLLEEQSKLASMGEMIGNIAHQWRQPLSIITSSASGLKVQSKFGIEITHEQLEEFSDLIVQQSNYLSNTIDNFRDFLKGDTNHKNIKLIEVIEYTLSLVSATIKNNNINLITDIDKDIVLRGSINELSEAFINIINNSKDVLKEKIEDQEDRLIFIETKPHDDESFELVFKDSGGGVDENIIERIFEPYFTSKHKSIGTGLGLSMADKIIRERHAGSINVYNDEYEYNGKRYFGACFKIILKKKV